jgi:hypothetical protein
MTHPRRFHEQRRAGNRQQVVNLDDYRRPTDDEVDAFVIDTLTAKLSDLEAEYAANGDKLGAALADVFRRALRGAP